MRREQERALAERVALRQRAIEAFRQQPEPPKGGADVLQIAVRLPDGSRIVRRFLQSDRVALLYTFVQASAVAAPWIDTFALVTDYPRRHLVNREVTLLHSGITNMALLVVTVNEETPAAEKTENSNAIAVASAAVAASSSAAASSSTTTSRVETTNDERQHVGSVAGF